MYFASNIYIELTRSFIFVVAVPLIPLDILDDKWMLVIVKQMLFKNKQILKDFTESDESVASNILSSKLKYLEQYEFIGMTNHETNIK